MQIPERQQLMLIRYKDETLRLCKRHAFISRKHAFCGIICMLLHAETGLSEVKKQWVLSENSKFRLHLCLFLSFYACKMSDIFSISQIYNVITFYYGKWPPCKKVFCVNVKFCAWRIFGKTASHNVVKPDLHSVLCMTVFACSIVRRLLHSLISC